MEVVERLRYLLLVWKDHLQRENSRRNEEEISTRTRESSG